MITPITDLHLDLINMLFDNADFVPVGEYKTSLDDENIDGGDDKDAEYLFDDYNAEEFKTLSARTLFPEDHERRLFIYTLVGNDEAYIVEGASFVNRVGYYFARKHIKLPETGIKYW